MQEKKIFECLNHERPSKHFLDIAKAVAKEDNLNVIKNVDCRAFKNDLDRDDYITNFYSMLYRKDEGVEGTIEDFLGEDIANSPLVTDSKLTLTERTRLDADLTIDELTKALGESNMKSAPGLDVFSNKFIYKFWNELRWPFFECCKSSLEEGTLLDSFAQIKIIPKKGDISQLKNWRPISLLSNFYKILLRAINNRLKTVVNRILSRSQKGFTKSRQIHEVIINIDESINECKKQKRNGAMICVDQSKAFDSVDHGFMEKAFKFFNFGEKFIGWLKTIGTNRKACVVLADGKTSNIFELLKGTAQGDCPSPIIYNICTQILIFKIELDPKILKLPVFTEEIINRQRQEIFKHESNFETAKNESFAGAVTVRP
jgi:hypothetical protein